MPRRYRLLKIFFIVHFSFFISELSAQTFSIRTLPTQSQLPVASVHCLMQDSEGYMWYGTEGGLCRDNGYQIDVFRPSVSERPQEASHINNIVENGNGDIVFGTSYGLYIINKKDYKVTPVKSGLSQQFIEALFVDSRKHLWVGCDGKFFECDGNGNVINRYSSEIDGKPAAVAGITEDSKGTIYVQQWRSGILRRQKNEKSFTPLLWPIAATPLQMIEDVHRQCFWILTSGAGVQRMTIDGSECNLTAQPATMKGGDQSRGLFMMIDNLHGLLWVTSQDNLYAYSLDANNNLQDVSLSSWLPEGNKILDQMCQDREGNIYVAGFTPHTFVITTEDRSITRREIPAINRMTGFPLLADRAIHEGNQHIWVWQGRKGLLLYDRESDEVQQLSWKVNRNIERSSMGGIWASHDSIVSRLWQERGGIANEQVVSLSGGASVRRIHESADGVLWIASDDHLYRLPFVSRLLQDMADLPAAPLDMSSDLHGNLYMALGSEGLYVARAGEAAKRIDHTKETFLSVTTMGDGSVWASTHEGHVYQYQPQRGTLELEPRLTTPNGAAVKCVRSDALGHVWAMTDQLVCEFAPVSRSYRIIRNTDRSVNVSYFYALEQMDQSHICIDGAGALIEVQSSSELNSQGAASVSPRVTAAVVNGTIRLIGKGQHTLELEPEENEVKLQLTTLDHQHVSVISFAYQVEGINREWVYLPQGMNTILINNLPKGSRKVKVMASDRNGCWSQPIDLLVLDRAPFWWQTWWANIIFIIVVLIFIYIIWKLERRIHLLRHLIHRRQEVRLDEIELKRDDIAELQRDDEFLRRAITKTEEHLSQPDYNVESLAEDMCMSRITLYRRIQEQTGQSPTDFIRDIRLKKAATLLLQHPEATIADIARKVGFSTPKYFSRCFRDKFGVLPRDYANSQESTHNTERNV